MPTDPKDPAFGGTTDPRNTVHRAPDIPYLGKTRAWGGDHRRPLDRPVQPIRRAPPKQVLTSPSMQKTVFGHQHAEGAEQEQRSVRLPPVTTVSDHDGSYGNPCCLTKKS